MKSIYLKPQHKVDLLPLIAEGLLLYDKITVDISDLDYLRELSTNLDKETLVELTESNAIEFAYQEEDLMTLSRANDDKIALTIFNNKTYSASDNSELEKEIFFNYENKISEILTPHYSNALTDKIISLSKNVEVDLNKIIEVCFNDYNGSQLSRTIDDFLSINISSKNYIQYLESLLTSPKGVRFPLENTDFESVLNEIKMQIICNTNMRLAYLTRFGDISCEHLYSTFIYDKLSQIFEEFYSDRRSDFLYQLFDIHDFLDVKELIKQKVLTIGDILKLRNKHGEVLRLWIDDLTVNKRLKPEKFSKEYSKILLNAKSDLSLKTRLVTFGLFSGLTTVLPITGTLIAGGFDFGLKELAKDWQPKIFFSSTKKMINKTGHNTVYSL